MQYVADGLTACHCCCRQLRRRSERRLFASLDLCSYQCAAICGLQEGEANCLTSSSAVRVQEKRNFNRKWTRIGEIKILVKQVRYRRQRQFKAGIPPCLPTTLTPRCSKEVLNRSHQSPAI